MPKPTLIIANKNYSSWSLRPWLLLAELGIPFEEKLIRFGEPAFGKAVRRISKAGRVPILQHNANTIWDSLAIVEYVAENWQDKHVWPKQKAARAAARSIAAEMHSGFQAFRNCCPMNLRRPPKAVQLNDAARIDIARIEQIWAAARSQYASGGAFLFGRFSAADAMFAPIATRFETYDIKIAQTSRHYVNTIHAMPSFQTWQKDALAEKWVVAEDEVD